MVFARKERIREIKMGERERGDCKTTNVRSRDEVGSGETIDLDAFFL